MATAAGPQPSETVVLTGGHLVLRERGVPAAVINPRTVGA